MLPGSGDRHAIQHLKEVKIQRTQQIVRRALIYVQLAPCVERLLCLAEDLVHRFCGIQLTVHEAAVTLIGKRQLIPQICEAVVDWCGGEH